MFFLRECSYRILFDRYYVSRIEALRGSFEGFSKIPGRPQKPNTGKNLRKKRVFIRKQQSLLFIKMNLYVKELYVKELYVKELYVKELY